MPYSAEIVVQNKESSQVTSTDVTLEIFVCLTQFGITVEPRYFEVPREMEKSSK